jgi:hypothetical protein
VTAPEETPEGPTTPEETPEGPTTPEETPDGREREVAETPDPLEALAAPEEKPGCKIQTGTWTLFWLVPAKIAIAAPTGGG